MRLLTLDNVHITNLHQKFRQSAVAQLAAAIIFLLPAVFIFYFSRGKMTVFAVLCILLSVLISLLIFGAFKKTLLPTNWLLAIGPGEIFIKFRSYHNVDLPGDDPQAVSLKLSDIASVNITKQTIISPGSRNSPTTSFHTFLDINVLSSDLNSLKGQLKYERNISSEKKTGFVTVRSKVRHYPVSVVDHDTIRIEWKSPADIVLPRIKKAILAFERQKIKIDPNKKEKIDTTSTGCK
ncbi:MAG: hypothetical protein ACYSWP_06695, partial [Planctomycetota bacterium]